MGKILGVLFLLYLMGNGNENLAIFIGVIWFIVYLNKKNNRYKYKYINKKSNRYKYKYLPTLSSEQKGEEGERIVSAILEKIAHENYYILINDVYLPLYDATTQIDHLLIGSFGVLVVETKNYRGRISGSIEDEQWRQELHDRSYLIYNPIKQNKSHARTVEYLLQKEKLFNVPVFHVVVFASNEVYLDLDERGIPVITANFLGQYLMNDRFQRRKIEPAKVVRVIRKNQITDSSVKARHIANIHKFH